MFNNKITDPVELEDGLKFVLDQEKTSSRIMSYSFNKLLNSEKSLVFYLENTVIKKDRLTVSLKRSILKFMMEVYKKFRENIRELSL